MKLTPMEIRAHGFKKAFRGFDAQEVEAFKDYVADALEEAASEVSTIEERLKTATSRIADLEGKETILKDTITTAQKMVENLHANARKEAELLIAEAKLQADNIVRQAMDRSKDLQEEIFRLRRQRIEIETSIRAVIDYHSHTLVVEGEESKRADEEADKLKFLSK